MGESCDFTLPLQPLPSLPKRSYNSLPLAPAWMLFMLGFNVVWFYGALQRAKRGAAGRCSDKGLAEGLRLFPAPWARSRALVGAASTRPY